MAPGTVMTATLKCGSFISLVALLVALYFGNDEFISNDRLENISHRLLKIESKNAVGLGELAPRVAVGYGACHDIFTNATTFLDFDRFDGAPQHFDDISSESEFLKSFAYYFQHGAAAERFMSNMELFEEIVERAEKMENAKWALGGNAPLMAGRFSTEGCKVMLGAKMTNRLKQYIPKEIKIVGGKNVEKDDVHLILEYKTDDKWGSFTASRANRYILHNDNNNPMLSSLEHFGTFLEGFSPNLLVVSGLQMMDNYPFEGGIREARLNLVKEQIKSLPLDTLVHFEMASYVEIKLLQDLIDIVIPHSDSIGMNEQELANLYNILQYGNVSFVTDSNPRVATALDQMRHILKLIRLRQVNIPGARTLTRIHVHTLAYQAILTIKGSKWKRTMAAAAKASLTAHRYVCASPDILLDKVKLVMDDSFATSANADQASRMNFDPSKPVSCWKENFNADTVEICVAPVLICTEAQITAGAGDNISASGLVLQI